MKRFLALLLLLPFGLQAETTTGGVNWLDPLGYTKPAFYPITLPTESGVANKYYVDLSAGGGSTCSSGSPCATLSAVSGKAGTTGGPAYIYVKGTGALGEPTLYGTAGNEVVIKPWDDATQATFTGRNDWDSNRVQYVVFDGGPNLRLKFSMNVANENDSALYFNHMTVGQHSNITFYRMQWVVENQGNWSAIWGRPDNLFFINNEFYTPPTSEQQAGHPLYWSGATAGAGSIGPIVIRNNIFRDSGGEAIEIRPFVTMTSHIVTGNAFHNLGKGKCSANWKCRSAITFGNSQDSSRQGSITYNEVSNNLIWDTGEGCIRPWQDNPRFYNNTCYNWGIGSPENGSYNRYALAGYSADGSATIRNNIFYADGNTASGLTKVPFDGSPFTANNNLCKSGTSCGSSSQTYSANLFQSLDPNNSAFLKVNAGSAVVAKGAETGITTDYFGQTRVASIDIGAHQAETVLANTVNFLDTLGYTKPAFVDLGLPVTSTNTYYVTATGSGTTCTSATPCALATVSGKAGTTGSGTSAIVYIKGNFGRLDTTGYNIRGYADNPVIIRPWPGDGTVAQFTASGSCGTQVANTIDGADFKHVVFDGGPNMQFRFTGASSCSGNDNSSTVVIRSDYITLYRVAVNNNGTGGSMLAPANGDNTHMLGFRLINSELYNTNIASGTDNGSYGVYVGGGVSCDTITSDDSGFENIEFRNNIIRDTRARGIQIEPRSRNGNNSSGVLITGNAFRNIGKYRLSHAVELATACSANVSGAVNVTNNLMFDLGGGGVLVPPWSGATIKVDHNTIYDYAKLSSVPQANGHHGITCPGPGGCTTASTSYNIILGRASWADQIQAINSAKLPSNTNKNLCTSSLACGNNRIAGSPTPDNTFQSILNTSDLFLKPKPGYLGQGLAANAGLVVDYFGSPRPDVGGKYDIGAGQVLTDEVAPLPTVTITPPASSVLYGTSFNVAYVVTDGTSCNRTGGNPPLDAWAGVVSGANASVSVTAYKTSTFTIVCSNTTGNSAPVSVTVTVPPPVVNFFVDKLAIYAGQSVTASWTVQQGVSCTGSGAGFAGTKTFSPTVTTEETVTLTADTTLTLSCENSPGNSKVVSYSIDTTPLPSPPTITLIAEDYSIPSGTGTNVIWAVSGEVESCTGTEAEGGNFALWNTDLGIAGGTHATGNLTADSNFRVTCAAPGGQTGTMATLVSVLPARPYPTVSLMTDKSAVFAGQGYTLSWVSTDVDSCEGSGAGTGAWIGPKPVQGSQTRFAAPPLTYTLTCLQDAISVSSTQNISLLAPLTLTWTATTGGGDTTETSLTVVTGETIDLDWSANLTGSCAATGDWVAAGLAVSGTHSVGAVAASKNYTMTCTDGTTTLAKTVHINVIAADTETDPELVLATSAYNVVADSSVTLTWVATSAQTCEASGGWTGAKGTQGVELSPPILKTTVFYLDCAGPGGVIRKSIPVTVYNSAVGERCRWWGCP